MKKEAEMFFRKYALIGEDEELSNDHKKIVSLIEHFAKQQVSKKKKSIVRIAKKYRRYESGVDKNGFVYISQLEAICR